MFSFLLLFPLIFFPAFAEPTPNYNDPYSPIFTDKPVYTWTDKIIMKIIAPSWNTDRDLIDSIGDDDGHFIKISTRENSLEPYRFTETDVNTGIFTAEIILTGFLHDIDGDGNFDTTPRTTGTGPTSGFLEVNRDSAVTISFEFADGVVMTESVPVKWNVGIIKFNQDTFLSGDTVIIRVVDFDMNLNPEALDHISVQIFSDSDIAGIIINAIETSESSGMFTGMISLSQTSTSSGNRLYSIPGDKIFAKYDDYTLPKPYSTSDSLEIITSANFESSILPINRLENTSIHFSDGLGNSLQSFSTNDQMQIIGTITNVNDFKQKFTYIFQVKNDVNYVESISWIQGELTANQSLDVSQSWLPKKSGIYQIETFVWSSLNDPLVLSQSKSASITVE